MVGIVTFFLSIASLGVIALPAAYADSRCTQDAFEGGKSGPFKSLPWIEERPRSLLARQPTLRKTAELLDRLHYTKDVWKEILDHANYGTSRSLINYVEALDEHRIEAVDEILGGLRTDESMAAAELKALVRRAFQTSSLIPHDGTEGSWSQKIDWRRWREARATLLNPRSSTSWQARARKDIVSAGIRLTHIWTEVMLGMTLPGFRGLNVHGSEAKAILNSSAHLTSEEERREIDFLAVDGGEVTLYELKSYARPLSWENWCSFLPQLQRLQNLGRKLTLGPSRVVLISTSGFKRSVMEAAHRAGIDVMGPAQVPVPQAPRIFPLFDDTAPVDTISPIRH